jgi:APA family basic amino acid/polyamine antiporter
MTHLALIRLRTTEPDLPRPYRVPLSPRLFGHEIPLPALFGLLGTGGVFLMVLIFHKYGRVFGTLWMVAGIAYYYTFRKTARMPLMDRLSVTELPAPPAPEETAHTTLLVATSPTAPSPVLPDVLKIAEKDGARVLVVTVLEVPLALPLYAPLAAEEEVARQTLSLCQAIGVERDILVDTHLLRGRSAGEVLVRVLHREHADTLVINDTGSAVVHSIEAALERSKLPVTLWKFRKMGSGAPSP